MMGIGSALVGCLPSARPHRHHHADTARRLPHLQGVANGGEWSGSVLLSMETGKQRKAG